MNFVKLTAEGRPAYTSIGGGTCGKIWYAYGKHEIQNTERTRQAMHVQRNIRARSCNHCVSGKRISITYSECVFVALCIQHAMRTCHVIFSSVA
jgi:hypothetical protein